MAPTKPTAGKSNKKLTDFFAVRQGTSSSPTPSPQPGPSNSSQQTQTSTKRTSVAPNKSAGGGKGDKGTKSTSKSNPEAVLGSSESHVSVPSNSARSKPVSKPRSTAADTKSKAASSTKLQDMAPVPRSTKSAVETVKASSNMQTQKRKSAFDVDTDSDASQYAIRVVRKPISTTHSTSSQNTKPKSIAAQARGSPLKPKENIFNSPQPPPAKKIRSSSPIRAVPGDLLPSSQSDERQIVLPREMGAKGVKTNVKETVSEWQQSFGDNTAIPSSDPPIADNEIDYDGSLSSLSTMSSPSAKANPSMDTDMLVDTPEISAPTTLGEPSRPTTPPQASQRSALPVTPKLLDPKEWTNRVIAEARAKAFADAASSSDDDELKISEFKLPELSDSDDDDRSFVDKMFNGERTLRSAAAKGKAKADDGMYDDEPDTSPTTAHESAGRYNTRKRRSSPRVAASMSLSANIGSASRNVKPKPKPAYNPIEAMVKKQKADEKMGRGAEARRMAEKAALRDEMDVEAGGHGWDDVEAAERAIREQALSRISPSPLSSMPLAGSSSLNSDDFAIMDEKKQKALGLMGDKKVNEILMKDREENRKKRIEGKGGEGESTRGIDIWEGLVVAQMGDEMDVDVFGVPDILGLENKVLKRVLACIASQELEQAELPLESGVIASIDPTQTALVVPYFCALALLSPDSNLSAAASNALHAFWSLDNSDQCLPLSVVVELISRLNPQKDFFSSIGWPISSANIAIPRIRGTRAEGIFRFADLVICAASRGKLDAREVPDFVVALLLVAMDNMTSHEAKIQLTNAIVAVCDQISDVAVEMATCLKLKELVSAFSAPNQSYMLSFIACGTDVSLRIASWVAYGLLFPAKALNSIDLRDTLPSLDEIADLLTPPRDSGEIFDVREVDSEEQKATNFNDLTARVQQLALVLYDVTRHAKQEPASSLPQAPMGSEEIQTPLVRVRMALEAVNGKINDTRAAHLDRSDAKLALQQLSMRLHHQRIAALQSRAGPHNSKPRKKLHEFFGRDNTGNPSKV